MTDITQLIEQTKQKSVLYVEDDPDICKNISELLQNIFKSVHSAYNGQEGLELYKKNSYDIVITDIKMPKMNGIALIEAIQAQNKGQKIIITTAHDEPDYLDKFAELGITQILQKPITFDSLVAVLKEISK